MDDHADIADANTFEMLLHHDSPSMVYPETDNYSRDLSSEQHPECSAPLVIQTVLGETSLNAVVTHFQKLKDTLVLW
jgi:hypothetical protein